jgi:hypothetical protein
MEHIAINTGNYRVYPIVSISRRSSRIASQKKNQKKIKNRNPRTIKRPTTPIIPHSILLP